MRPHMVQESSEFWKSRPRWAAIVPVFCDSWRKGRRMQVENQQVLLPHLCWILLYRQFWGAIIQSNQALFAQLWCYYNVLVTNN